MIIIDKINKKITILYDSKVIDKIVKIGFIFLIGVACGYTWMWMAIN